MMIDFSSGFSVFTSAQKGKEFRELHHELHLPAESYPRKNKNEYISLFLIWVDVTFRVQKFSETKVVLGNVEG